MHAFIVLVCTSGVTNIVVSLALVYSSSVSMLVCVLCLVAVHGSLCSIVTGVLPDSMLFSYVFI